MRFVRLINYGITISSFRPRDGAFFNSWIIFILPVHLQNRFVVRWASPSESAISMHLCVFDKRLTLNNFNQIGKKKIYYFILFLPDIRKRKLFLTKCLIIEYTSCYTCFIIDFIYHCCVFI